MRLRLQLTLIGPGGEEIWSSTVDGENKASAETVEEIVEQMRGVLEDTLRGQRDALAAALAEAG